MQECRDILICAFHLHSPYVNLYRATSRIQKLLSTPDRRGTPVLEWSTYVPPYIPFSARKTALLGQFYHRQHFCRSASQSHTAPHTRKKNHGQLFWDNFVIRSTFAPLHQQFFMFWCINQLYCSHVLSRKSSLLPLSFVIWISSIGWTFGPWGAA